VPDTDPDHSHDHAASLLEGQLRRLGRAKATIQSTVAALRRLLVWLDRQDQGQGNALSHVTRADLERFLADRARVLSPTSQAQERARLRAALRALEAAGQLPQGDPAAQLAAVHAPPRLQSILAAHDVERLLCAASQLSACKAPLAVRRALALRDRGLLELLYGAGLRASEVADARTVDLDPASCSLLVRAVKRGPMRRVPLPEAVSPHLLDYLRDGRPVLSDAHPSRGEGRLFLTRTGRPLDRQVVHHVVRRAGRVAGLAAHPHQLRRSLATHLVRAGVPVPTVQHLLGHARLASTATYLRLDVSDLRHAVEVLEFTPCPDRGADPSTRAAR
jgi:site-specific recombinase XerD